MTECVIDRLKFVEIDEHQRHLGFITARLCYGLMQTVGKEGSVREPCKQVVMRQVLSTLLGRLALGNIGKYSDIVGRQTHVIAYPFERKPFQIQVAILAAIADFALPGTSSKQTLPHILVKLRRLSGGGKHLRILSDNFIRQITGDARERGINRDDSIFQVSHYDRFVHGV